MAHQKLELQYDPKGDVLYCSFGAPVEAVSVETSEGVFVRLSQDTNVPVGVTIIDFSKRFREHPESFLPIELPISVHSEVWPEPGR